MIIGIDPDFEKSGVACIADTKELAMTNLTFVQTVTFVREHKDLIKCVYLEAGWLNATSSYHFAENKKTAARIGKNVGMNHATGQLLQQSIEAEGVKVILVKPTTKKYNQLEFQKLTKTPVRTNQEQRDAAMLIWGR